MRRLLLIIFLYSFLLNQLFSQYPPLNTTSVGQLAYPNRLSSVWHYKHPGGTEYALVGTYNGVSIVNVNSNIYQNQLIPGAPTIWRELKTWQNYLYVVSEQVSQGLLIADLSGLPHNVHYQYKFLTVGNDTVRNAHTLFIDTNGYLYLSGADVADGAPLIFDLNQDPSNPIFLGIAGTEYAHDLFVRGDTLWAANSYISQFSVFNISDKSNPILLATQATRGGLTHNVWLSDDSQTLFTTDERPASWVDAYDITDFSDIKLLDGWRPKDAVLRGTIPHNVHVLNDYLVIAHYTDGVIIVDAKHPDNLVKVGAYDTYPQDIGGFAGCWGVSPYLPSGKILASDIQTGLHVISPVYKRACRLQGQISDALTSLPLYGVQIEIMNTDAERTSKLDGFYKTGIHSAGNYQVRFRKTGYIPHIVSIDLFNDSISVLNVAMQAAVNFNSTGKVVLSDDPSQGVANAKVKYIQSAFAYETETVCNAAGNFSTLVQEEEYLLVGGKWGYKTKADITSVNSSFVAEIALDTAIYDDFIFDYGWTVSGVDSGAWEIAVPNSVYEWTGMMPKADIWTDVKSSRSDQGATVLTSPGFDGTKYDDPHLAFHYWFSNFDSTFAIHNDTLQVFIDNGTDNVLVASYLNGLYSWSNQILLKISDYTQVTDNMNVSFRVSNSFSNNYLEAAIDKFEVNELSAITNTEYLSDLENNSVTLSAFPIPFGDNINIEYRVLVPYRSTQFLKVFNLFGKLVETRQIETSNGSFLLGSEWPAGVYFIQLGDKSLKLIKH